MADLRVENGKVVYIDDNGKVLYALPVRGGNPGQSVVYDDNGNLTAGAGTTTLGSLLNVDSTVDSATSGRVLSFNGTYWEAIDLSVGDVVIDSDYVQARQDFEYSSLTGAPNVLGSTNVISIVNDNATDSSKVTSIINEVVTSSYVQNRQSTNATTLNNFSSSYFLNYNNLNNTPTNVSEFTNDVKYLDSTTVVGVIDQSYVRSNQITYNTSDFVDSAYVQSQIDALVDGAPEALNTLNEIAAALNDDDSVYNTLVELINNQLDSAEVVALVDSDYVQLRQDYAYSSLTGAPEIPSTTDSITEGDNLYYTTIRFDSDFGDNTTDDLTEGNNLYYTTTRADSDFDVRLATKSTSDLAEGDNLYYTTVRFDSDFNDNTTDDLSEGLSNLYYTTVRFDSDFGDNTTDDLAEGDNLYYTTARHDSDTLVQVDSAYIQLRQDDHNLTSSSDSTSLSTNLTIKDHTIISDDNGIKLNNDSDQSRATLYAALPTYDSIGLLPTTHYAGEQAFIPSNGRLYISTGSGWYNVALINKTPLITSVNSSLGDSLGSNFYQLGTLGTSLTVTILATDSDGDTLNYSATLSAGANNIISSITNADNVFTINPLSRDSADAEGYSTSGTITFSVNDGINTANTSALTFSLQVTLYKWTNAEVSHVVGEGTSSGQLLGITAMLDSDYAIVNHDELRMYILKASIGSNDSATWSMSDVTLNILDTVNTISAGHLYKNQIVIGAKNYDAHGQTNNGGIVPYRRDSDNGSWIRSRTQQAISSTLGVYDAQANYSNALIGDRGNKMRAWSDSYNGANEIWVCGQYTDNQVAGTQSGVYHYAWDGTQGYYRNIGRTLSGTTSTDEDWYLNKSGISIDREHGKTLVFGDRAYNSNQGALHTSKRTTISSGSYITATSSRFSTVDQTLTFPGTSTNSYFANEDPFDIVGRTLVAGYPGADRNIAFDSTGTNQVTDCGAINIWMRDSEGADFYQFQVIDWDSNTFQSTDTKDGTTGLGEGIALSDDQLTIAARSDYRVHIYRRESLDDSFTIDFSSRRIDQDIIDTSTSAMGTKQYSNIGFSRNGKNLIVGNSLFDSFGTPFSKTNKGKVVVYTGQYITS